MKRYVQLFFMFAVTVLIVMGIQKGLSTLNVLNLENFWANYVVFLILAYMILSFFLHYFSKRKKAIIKFFQRLACRWILLLFFSILHCKVVHFLIN